MPFALLWVEEVATNMSLFFCKGRITVAVRTCLFISDVVHSNSRRCKANLTNFFRAARFPILKRPNAQIIKLGPIKLGSDILCFFGCLFRCTQRIVKLTFEKCSRGFQYVSCSHWFWP